MRVCPSVGPSVGPSVRPSVRRSVGRSVTLSSKTSESYILEQISHKTHCKEARNLRAADGLKFFVLAYVPSIFFLPYGVQNAL